MPKLTNLKGSEVLPKKEIIKIKHPEKNPSYFWSTTGYNQCVQELDKIGVVGKLDREKLRVLLINLRSPDRKVFVNKQDWIKQLCDELTSNQSSLIELELVVEKE